MECDENVVTERPTYYLPHIAVIYKDRSKTNKLRVVFDASSHFTGYLSLKLGLVRLKKCQAQASFESIQPENPTPCSQASFQANPTNHERRLSENY